MKPVRIGLQAGTGLRIIRLITVHTQLVEVIRLFPFGQSGKDGAGGFDGEQAVFPAGVAVNADISKGISGFAQRVFRIDRQADILYQLTFRGLRHTTDGEAVIMDGGVKFQFHPIIKMKSFQIGLNLQQFFCFRDDLMVVRLLLL